MPQAQLDARQAVSDYHVGDYADAKRLLAPLAKETDENYVLNNCRLGSVTVANYDLQTSQAAFLRAYEVLNAYGVNNAGRTLATVTLNESAQVWRGEPFDRAMANFYLGLTYYMAADYANARGAFENALFKLHDYDAAGDNGDAAAGHARDVDSDFVLADYLLARCYQRLGKDDQATATFATVARLRPGLTQLADVDRNRRSNVLLVIDFGDGPRKGTDVEGSFVGFVPRPNQVGPPPRPEVSVDGTYVDVAGADAALVDLIVLAQDHRWQSLDTIHTVKNLLGTGLIAGGAGTALYSRDRTATYAGLGAVALGLALKATSQADLRVWDTLPRSTYAIPLTLSPGKHDVAVTFPAAGGVTRTIAGLVAPAAGDNTYYFRLGRYDFPPISWPPPTLTGWPEPPTPAAPPRPTVATPPVPPTPTVPPVDLPAPP